MWLDTSNVQPRFNCLKRGGMSIKSRLEKVKIYLTRQISWRRLGPFIKPIVFVVVFYYAITRPTIFFGGLDPKDQLSIITGFSSWMKLYAPLPNILFVLLATGLVLGAARARTRWKEAKVARTMGAFFAKPNFDPADQEASVAFLRKSAEESLEVYLIGASGWNTFGAENSPLYEAVKHAKRLKVLLAYPNSIFLEKRAVDIGLEAQEMKEQIYKSTQMLEELRAEGNDVQLKFYDRYPTWKYILCGNFLWVQQYPKKRKVSQSPCFAFQPSLLRISSNGDRQETLFDALHREFFGMWSHKSRVWSYDFDDRKLYKIVDVNGVKSSVPMEFWVNDQAGEY